MQIVLTYEKSVSDWYAHCIIHFLEKTMELVNSNCGLCVFLQHFISFSDEEQENIIVVSMDVSTVLQSATIVNFQFGGGQGITYQAQITAV